MSNVEKIKNEKTKVYIGNTKPTAATLAAAREAADTGFDCTITSMDGFEETRGTSADDAVYCGDEENFTPDDTDELKVSNFTLSGYVANDSADYDAAEAKAKSMLRADTQGTFFLIEPDGVQCVWSEIKIVKFAKKRGGPKERQRFEIEVQARTLPSYEDMP